MADSLTLWGERRVYYVQYPAAGSVGVGLGILVMNVWGVGVGLGILVMNVFGVGVGLGILVMNVCGVGVGVDLGITLVGTTSFFGAVGAGIEEGLILGTTVGLGVGVGTALRDGAPKRKLAKRKLPQR